MKKTSEQELFWQGNFGNEYIARNIGEDLLAANVSFFSRALAKAENVNSVVEFGANVGMNLSALKVLYPRLEINAVEINSSASDSLKENHPDANVYNCSILEFKDLHFNLKKADLCLIKTVLIHINPDQLKETYEVLVESTSRYLLVAEYYNTVPVTITYRGHSDRLFKRDFAGEILKNFPDFRLLDYGFVYHGEKGPVLNLIDDISWFLLEKKSAV